VDLILEQWDAPRLFIDRHWFEDKTHGAENLKKWLNDPFIKLYFIFLQWVLPKVTEMNACFQSSKVVVTSLLEKMSECYKFLLATYLRNDYVARTCLSQVDPRGEGHFKPLADLYLGNEVRVGLERGVIRDVDAEEVRQNRPSPVLHFKTSCRQFLMTLCCQIKERFDFGDELLAALPALTPQSAKSYARRQPAFKETTMPLCDLAPRVVPSSPAARQSIDDQWRLLHMDTLPRDLAEEAEIDVFWAKVSLISAIFLLPALHPEVNGDRQKPI
jgi:hypothetical protein